MRLYDGVECVRFDDLIDFDIDALDVFSFFALVALEGGCLDRRDPTFLARCRFFDVENRGVFCPMTIEMA